MRVVVTGGCGFIGRYVVEELVCRKHQVTVVDNLLAVGSEAPQISGVKFVRGDLTDRSVAQSAFEGSDVCICLAARSSGIGYFNTHPAEMLNENVGIVSATFEAARIKGHSRIIYISSSCVFDNCSTLPIIEIAAKQSPPPSSGYPFSKLIGEAYCDAYLNQYELGYTIIRPFNVYGRGEMPGKTPGDSHVIPDLTAKILSGQYPLEIFGDGQQTRCFTNVDDIVRGIILALENPLSTNQDFNLGHPREIKIIDLAKLIWAICGRKERFSVYCLKAFRNDVSRRVVNCDKAKELLNWEAAVDLEQGLSDYVEWFQRRMANSKASQ